MNRKWTAKTLGDLAAEHDRITIIVGDRIRVVGRKLETVYWHFLPNPNEPVFEPSCFAIGPHSPRAAVEQMFKYDRHYNQEYIVLNQDGEKVLPPAPKRKPKRKAKPKKKARRKGRAK